MKEPYRLLLAATNGYDVRRLEVFFNIDGAKDVHSTK